MFLEKRRPVWALFLVVSLYTKEQDCDIIPAKEKQERGNDEQI